MISKHLVLRSTPLLWTVLLGFAPWLLAPLVFGKWGVAASLVFIFFHIAGLGYLILFCFGFFEDSPSLKIAFAPGTGVIVQSGLLYLAVRFEFNSSLMYLSACALGWVGGIFLIRSLRQRSQSVSDGRHLRYLVLLSIVVCLYYFVTDIRKNHVNSPDNGYSFLHPDSAQSMAIAAAIKNGVKPWSPTIAEIPLVYHYGSQSIAGCYSRVTGTCLSNGMLALGGAGLISLLSASIGLAALVSRMFGGDSVLGPIAGGVGVFFLLDTTVILHRGFRLLVRMFGFSVWDIGDFPFTTGPSATFHYGGSVIWGSLSLIVILSLALWHWDTNAEMECRRTWMLPLLTAFIFPLNIFAGIAASGSMFTVAAIRGVTDRKNWVFAIIIVISSIGILWAMGVVESSQFSDYTAVLLCRKLLLSLLASSAERTATLFWIFLGFGVGLVPIGMIFSQQHRHPLTLILLILVTGGFILATFFGVNSVYNDNLYILRCSYHFSVVCSMAILSRAFREWVEGGRFDTFVELSRGVWMLITIGSLIFLTSQLCGWVISLDGTHPFYDRIVRIFAPIMTASLSFWLWRNIRQSITARSVSLMILTCVALLQIGGVARQIYIYAYKMPLVSNNPLLVLDSNELKGLIKLRSISEPNDLCATNRNLIGKLTSIGTTFQVLYTPLSERRFLIETPFPSAMIGTDDVRSDNRLLFESSDTEAVRYVVNKHKIRFLVCTPGTDLALAKNLPSWLYRVPESGSLKIYGIHN